MSFTPSRLTTFVLTPLLCSAAYLAYAHTTPSVTVVPGSMPTVTTAVMNPASSHVGPPVQPSVQQDNLAPVRGVTVPSQAAPVMGAPVPSNKRVGGAPVSGTPVQTRVVVPAVVLTPLVKTHGPMLVELHSNATDQPISVTAKTFTLSLPSNPTTGYRWFLKDYNSSLIRVVGHRYVAQRTNLVGSGGNELWTFTLSDAAFGAPHLLTVTLRYARAFDLENGNDKTVTITTK